MKKLFGLAVVCLVALTGCGAGPMAARDGSTSAGNLQSVKHIVILMQENRSFDTYFAKLNEYRAAHGLGSTDVDSLPMTVSLPTWDGTPPVSPFHMNSACSANMSSAWQESKVDLEVTHPATPNTPPSMDGFVFVAGGFCEHTGCTDTSGAR